MSQPANLVNLERVSKSYGIRMLLDGVSLGVGERQRIGVVGRNGDGKSTLLDLVAGVTEPDLGRVSRGRGVRVGHLVQGDPLVPHETVRDVVLTAAYGMTGRWRESYESVDESRAADLMAAFGVGRFAERRYGTLSEGERKRVQIARALMSDPELLLLDAPAAGLDLGGREELVAALSELAADRRSPVLVLVTHHVEEIPPGFTHLLLLADGRVHAAGPVDEVLTSENLSGAFGTSLQVEKSGDRWTARGTR